MSGRSGTACWRCDVFWDEEPALEAARLRE
jgi:hypothetical protein